MRISTLLQWALLSGLATSTAFGQEPAQPAQPSPIVIAPQVPAPPPAAVPGSAPKRLPFFLILGTVFHENALAFPGVEVRIRRMDEKKFRWESTTNSRGEFAVRVPDGYDYSVLIRAKHYQDETRAITTKAGEAQQQVTIRMQPITQEKAGSNK